MKIVMEYTHANVMLFKPSGKYYTEETWRIPNVVPRDNGDFGMRDVIGPYDMIHSPDFRRIDGGAVFVVTQEPWGYPALFMPEPASQESIPQFRMADFSLVRNGYDEPLTFSHATCECLTLLDGYEISFAQFLDLVKKHIPECRGAEARRS